MHLDSDKLIGLSDTRAAELSREFGKNSLPAPKGKSAIMVFISQFTNPLVLVILVASLISLGLREFKDAIVILAVVALNAVMGFFQEFRAEKTYQALRSLLKPMADVIRDKQRKMVLAEDLVPGDLVILTAGDHVPADGIVLESAALAVNEAILTGESQLVFKDEKERDKVFMGTTVGSGRGIMEVKSIGANTELGKISISLAATKSAPTPLQVQLKRFSISLTALIFILVVFIFGLSIFSGTGFLYSLRLAVILAVGAIPEGLLIAVTVILVLGMQRILKRKGLIKKLLAVETLGAVTTICTDKTGTLTEGNARVTKTDFADEKKAHLALILCNNLEDNLEVAFWDYVRKQDGFDHSLDHSKTYPRVEEEPFSSENKYMVTVNKVDGVDVSFLKGAPEVVLEMCHMHKEKKQTVLQQSDNWAGQGMKVLGMAYKQDGKIKEKAGFIWLGLVAVEDPVREGVREAVELCQQAQIKIKIVSGDHPKTAISVARQLGIGVKDAQVILGNELERISTNELAERIGHLVVFARISPHQKRKIVEALQLKKEIVAMVGDGVNDAPAIKKADIGIATGEVSDVAKEVASLILLDSNFRTIVAAVEEGRTIFENIKKVINYVLSNSFADLAVITAALFFGWSAPIAIAQILWIHLICDGPVDIVLGFEPREKEVMGEHPQKFSAKILDKWGKFLVCIVSLTLGGICLVYFWYFGMLKGDLALARTIVFTALAIASLIYIFSYRSFRYSFLKTKNLFQNKYLLGAVGLGFLTQFAAIYLPRFNEFFSTRPLGFFHWILALIPGIVAVIIIETAKLVRIKMKF